MLIFFLDLVTYLQFVLHHGYYESIKRATCNLTIAFSRFGKMEQDT